VTSPVFTSILIVTYNSAGTIEECLRGVEAQSVRDFEVIVVDNRSTDETVRVIELLRPHLRFPLKTVYHDQNLGFAAGNNLALQHASSNLVALLNPDAIPVEGWLQALRSAMDDHPEAGICASRIVVYGAQAIDSAGDGYSRALRGYKRGEGQDPERFAQAGYVFGACAGAALYRRAMIDDVGFFDEQYFLIHEDTDLNLRAQMAGWKVWYVPEALVYHKVRSSIGHMSDTAVYYSLRNSELARLKSVPWSVFLRCLPEVLAQFLLEFAYFALKYRKPLTYMRAKLDTLRLLPHILRMRRRMMEARRITNGQLVDILTPVWQRDFLKEKLKKLIAG
jgi:GT2 family glycosyltransferase